MVHFCSISHAKVTNFLRFLFFSALFLLSLHQKNRENYENETYYVQAHGRMLAGH